MGFLFLFFFSLSYLILSISFHEWWTSCYITRGVVVFKMTLPNMLESYYAWREISSSIRAMQSKYRKIKEKHQSRIRNVARGIINANAD